MGFAKLKRPIGALVLVVLLVLLITPAQAAGSNELVLSGEISGVYNVPEGIIKVILDGVTAADFESGVKIPGEAEVVLTDGTENTCGIMCQGDLHVTGGGSLLGGPGIYAFGNLTLDLTGNVVLEGGQIAAFGGDVIVNSGVYRLQSLPEGGGGLLVSSRGNVLLNGGDVRIFNDTVGVTATDGAISVEKTELDISAEDAVMVAKTITLPEAAQAAVDVQATDEQDSGQVIVAAGAPAKRLKLTRSGAVSEAEKGDPVITDGKADIGASIALGERAADAENVDPTVTERASVDPFAWAAAGLAMALAVATAVYFVLKKKRN